jgi:hypothetical protein
MDTINPWTTVFEGLVCGIAVRRTDIGDSNQDAVGFIPTVGGTVAGPSCPRSREERILGMAGHRSHKSKDRKDHFEEKYHVEIKLLEIEVVLIDRMKTDEDV